MRIILASGSPRRREILAEMGLSFEVLVTDADESVPSGLTPTEACEQIARIKCEAAVGAAGNSDTLVIAADTIVTKGGVIYGKPEGTRGAEAMLAALSGGLHSVITAICVCCNGVYASDIGETFVSFREMSADEIAEYVATGEPMDKSGSYAIQGGAAKFVEKIDGDIGNVIGISARRLAGLLNKFGINQV
jgi:MAF protein